MKILIDADGCPVVDIALSLGKAYGISCLIICDTAHYIYRDGAETLVVDKGADSADLAIANRAQPGDIVITQDYGLASMCLAKDARVLHQNGWAYTQYNIDALLLERHEARRYRAGGGRTKGPSRRTRDQDAAFHAALQKLLQG